MEQIVSCPECNNEVSALAALCTHCGNDLARARAAQAEYAVTSSTTANNAEAQVFTKSPVLHVFYIILAAALAGFATFLLLEAETKTNLGSKLGPHSRAGLAPGKLAAARHGLSRRWREPTPQHGQTCAASRSQGPGSQGPGSQGPGPQGRGARGRAAQEARGLVGREPGCFRPLLRLCGLL